MGFRFGSVFRNLPSPPLGKNGGGGVRAAPPPSPVPGPPQGTSGTVRVRPASSASPFTAGDRRAGIEGRWAVPPPTLPRLNPGRRRGLRNSVDASRPPPPEEGWGRPAPSRPPSFPREAAPARVAAEPHCCSEAAEKAPLNSGGRGPDPGGGRDWHAAHFLHQPPHPDF